MIKIVILWDACSLTNVSSHQPTILFPSCPYCEAVCTTLPGSKKTSDVLWAALDDLRPSVLVLLSFLLNCFWGWVGVGKQLSCAGKCGGRDAKSPKCVASVGLNGMKTHPVADFKLLTSTNSQDFWKFNDWLLVQEVGECLHHGKNVDLFCLCCFSGWHIIYV